MAAVRPIRHLPILGFLFFSISASLRLLADSWSTFGHDPQNTSRSSAAFDPRNLQLSWESPVPNFPVPPVGYVASAISGNSVYTFQFEQSGPYINQVASFDLSNGHNNWIYSDNIGSSLSSLAVSDGLVAFTSGYPQANLTLLDAQTGTLKYNVANVPGTFYTGGPSPVLAHTPAGQLVAYTAGPGSVGNISLGSTSGQLTRIQGGSLGGGAAPTLIGNSVVAAGPGQFYAYNQADGYTNHFLTSATTGGGADTTVYDSTRQQFYVPDGGWLTAFKYLNNDTITQLWTVPGGFGVSNRIALGPGGKIYAFTNKAINEIDPDTGAILRSAPGTFQDYVPPLIQGNYLWVGGYPDVTAYDLTTLAPIMTLTPGKPEYYYYEPAAVDDSHLVINYANGVGSNRGFIVYAVPDPNPTTLLPIAATFALPLRGRRMAERSS